MKLEDLYQVMSQPNKMATRKSLMLEHHITYYESGLFHQLDKVGYVYMNESPHHISFLHRVSCGGTWYDFKEAAKCIGVPMGQDMDEFIKKHLEADDWMELTKDALEEWRAIAKEASKLLPLPTGPQG